MNKLYKKNGPFYEEEDGCPVNCPHNVNPDTDECNYGETCVFILTDDEADAKRREELSGKPDTDPDKKVSVAMVAESQKDDPEPCQNGHEDKIVSCPSCGKDFCHTCAVGAHFSTYPDDKDYLECPHCYNKFYMDLESW